MLLLQVFLLKAEQSRAEQNRTEQSRAEKLRYFHLPLLVSRIRQVTSIQRPDVAFCWAMKTDLLASYNTQLPEAEQLRALPTGNWYDSNWPQEPVDPEFAAVHVPVGSVRIVRHLEVGCCRRSENAFTCFLLPHARYL
jgi:hypothetical protein